MKTGAVITAGGCGNFGDGIPKLLHKLPDGKSIINTVVDLVRSAGVDEVVVTENNYHFPNIVRDHLFSCGVGNAVAFAHQNERSGAARAVQLGVEKLSGDISSVLVVYGDMPLWRESTLRSLISVHLHEQADISMVSLRLGEDMPNGFRKFGRIIRSGERITAIYEVRDDVPEEIIEAADSVSPSLFLFDREWLEEHLPLIRPVDPGDGFGCEYHLPKILITDSKASISEMVLAPDQYDEARGINTLAEYGEACKIIRQRGG